jgi:acyl carrier protein
MWVVPSRVSGGVGVMPQSMHGRFSPHEVQQELVDIWMDVLQIRDVNTQDEFLDLGGDSLAAMLCISRLRSRFGVSFSVEDFFFPGATISSFTEEICRSDSE